MKLTTHVHIAPRLQVNGAVVTFLSHAFIACTRTTCLSPPTCPWLTCSVAVLLQRRPGFSLQPVPARNVVDKVNLKHISVRNLYFGLPSCHYLSTNAPHSYFIHLPPTQYGLSSSQCPYIKHFCLTCLSPVVLSAVRQRGD